MKPYFEQNKNQSGSQDIDRPYYVGLQATDQEGYHIPPHWHYHMEIIYMAHGSAEVRIGSTIYKAKQGDLILIQPCEVHTVSVPTHTPSLHYVIGFNPELLRPMPQLAFNIGYMLPYAASFTAGQKLVSSKLSDMEMLHILIEEMYTEYQTKAPGFELAVTSNIYKLVVWLLRQQQNTLEAETSVEDAGILEKFHKTLIYLNENCHEEISAAEVAKLSMMSYSRFASLFKRLMNTSLTPYVMFLRIRKAEQLLLDSSKSITEIAIETGFNSSSYFIKHFKRAKGISPRQYRKNLLLPPSK